MSRRYGADAYRDDIPTRAECDADEHGDAPGAFHTGPAGSALAALSEAVNRARRELDNLQH